MTTFTHTLYRLIDDDDEQEAIEVTVEATVVWMRAEYPGDQSGYGCDDLRVTTKDGGKVKLTATEDEDLRSIAVKMATGREA
jgi:hypothetical protein